MLALVLTAIGAQAQVSISGKVFGGARQADIGGDANVHIGGEGSPCDMVLNAVYGGNDISGTIGGNVKVTTSKVQEDDATNRLFFIGRLFGGSYGDYDYTSPSSPYYEFRRPTVEHVTLHLNGGTFGYVYGGGDAATVTGTLDIHINNGTARLTPPDNIVLTRMNINTVYYTGTYQFSRVFGGNNKADMAIRPTWHLDKGSINSLFSGGNEGRMTSREGILLEVPATSEITVNNLYGGCRKADVKSLDDAGNYVYAQNIAGYNFPDTLSARVIVRGGDINNVYGGNDVSGKVWGGAAIGIYHSIKGNVFGGGNGSYPYTDNPNLADNLYYGDYYYTKAGGQRSVEALNAFRPVTESVSLFVKGTSAEDKTIIGGAIYCGGNSTTLHSDDPNITPYSELKIGSHVIADKVFLGNNGADMIKTDVLQQLAGSVTYHGAQQDFSGMDLTKADEMSAYMSAVTMDIMPRVVFASAAEGGYDPYSSQFGSFYCGGNVGSMRKNGLTVIDFSDKVIIYDKLVGGCNNANVAASAYNAAYKGGLTGTPVNGNKLQLNLSGLKIHPKRWVDENDKSKGLEWNTWIGDTKDVLPASATTGSASDDDKNRRFLGGNIYGGCCESGYVNGNVIINVNNSIVDRDILFDRVEEEGEAIMYGHDTYTITERRTGVLLDEQGMDVLGTALNIFGGGKGVDTEIWGSTTINLKAGYCFQVFGGSEEGVIGKKTATPEYNAAYSTYINLNGTVPGRSKQEKNETMSECEFIYGGGFEGPVYGDTHVNLGNGRIFNSFAGSCNADILGHTETYVGQWNTVKSDGTVETITGFPWVRDHIYGGNDLGGRIIGAKNFADSVRYGRPMVYDDAALSASAYMEYTRGRVDAIFGGCYGDYDYSGPAYTGRVSQKPYLHNAFVNIRPVASTASVFSTVYGAGQGCSGERDGDKCQDRSYVLIDIPDGVSNFEAAQVFGAGAFDGLGMRYTQAETTAAGFDRREASGIIDLMRGKITAAYGASYQEGVTRRTVVNVPAGSTIQVKDIFGGAYGTDNAKPCDAIEAVVNYDSGDALVTGAIYGGNNSKRRTLYGQVNINAPLYETADHQNWSKVYGAGYGADTWSEYVEVNVNAGGVVNEVYGGGRDGRVLNRQSLAAWKGGTPTVYEGYTYSVMDATLARHPYNTNVFIQKDAAVKTNTVRDADGLNGGYAYGGGHGSEATVSGTTGISVLGGRVDKDVYGGGWGGSVLQAYGTAGDANSFTAATYVNIEGGKVRKVYGGGYQGSVGKHEGMMFNGKFSPIAGPTTGDIPGEAHVTIGIRGDQPASQLPEGGLTFYKGVPTVEFNAYGGGEGGSVFGTAYLTINNGYIGYYYDTADGKYKEKVDDETYYEDGVWKGHERLIDCGNAFGAGYDDLSTCDETSVKVWGGVIRNGLFGGGEIATVGRGRIIESGDQNAVRLFLRENYFKAGKTHIEMYNGHVKRNVFGGGKGYNHLRYGTGNNLYTDGYVFGQTSVHIHGGEIGTAEGIANGDGNVFGGGDIGYVYSRGFFDSKSRNTSTGSPNHYYYYDGDDLTEDCQVIVSPYLQIKPDGSTVTFDGKTYGPYDYVPTDYLNTLPRQKDAQGEWTGQWTNFITEETGADGRENDRGVLIHNAVFAGGNVASNSDKTYANATTVFGNTTATLYDVYHRDFITVGTEHTGGLYGGGNLSVVDGYRELNITNYGTDYYGLDQQITLAEYEKLSTRERAYFQLEYLCQQEHTIAGKTYKVGDKISEEEYNHLGDTSYQTEAYWKKYGFCSIYAGRLLNTIQRADLCGVYGSRLVLQGARDRVATVGDATEYTINRVGEVSLNKQGSIISSDTGDDASHGNYFGIYSVVNYMGNLTSDVKFEHTYKTIERSNNKDVAVEKPGTTYFSWKTNNLTKKTRNIGTCHNQVALASGVFLELTTEMSTNTKKEYGLITGIVELDLINVKKDIVGGGYVYAKNQHGARTFHQEYKNVILSSYNKDVGNGSSHVEARTYKRYTYSKTSLEHFETSGNFIHRRKRIIDDCYPNNGVYNDTVKSPAHYWFIKGEVYIYDQTVSAYAGAATAYSKEVKIPLTITAGSNGRLKLLNVQPSLYAYYKDYQMNDTIDVTGLKVDNESMTFYRNEVITWWDWSQLPQAEQKCFVRETYVNVDSCYVGGKLWPAGTYVVENDPLIHNAGDKTDYQKLRDSSPVVKNVRGQVVDFDDVFHPSNNISHDKGYVLTFDMDSPKEWDDWYTIKTGEASQKLSKEAFGALSRSAQEAYRAGPTFRLKQTQEAGLYGQKDYVAGQIISEEIYTDYTTTVGRMSSLPTGQAQVDIAYVAKNDIVIGSQNITAGNAISKASYDGLTDKSNFEVAWLCVNTIQMGEEDYVFNGNLVADSELASLAARYKAYNNSLENMEQISDDEALEHVKSCMSKAYIVTQDGKYGGQYFEHGINYSALKSWCSLTDDRERFDFNYDAFDVLVDPTYSGEDRTEAVYKSPYSDEKEVEYNAANTGTATITYQLNDGTEKTLAPGETITREEFENVRNDQRHYTRVTVKAGGGDVYIAKTSFYDSGTPYGKGQDLTENEYNSLSEANKAKVETRHIDNAQSVDITRFYCYESYGSVTAGTDISQTEYEALANDQKKFTIQGVEPTETTTLYVSRESVHRDVTSEKVISVVYQYTYYEDDDEGEGVTLTNELHVVNIHLKLESGVPQIGQLNNPPLVLPGRTVGLKQPSVNPGLYEIINNGWEIFASEDDAMYHRNGKPFTNNITPVYWYQNQQYYIAFYSNTYLGKTYSNSVPVRVANYHDLSAVMADKAHHLYIDHGLAAHQRAPKVYLDQTKHDGENQLTLLKQLFDLSTGAALDGHQALNTTQVGNAKNLEFILRSNLAADGDWTSIGAAGHCFEGNLHGDGYTISGLSSSLFSHLCGEVYNLGVTGTFTTAGIADSGTGYMENCWVKKDAGRVTAGTKALFNNPTDNSDRTVHLFNCYYPEENGYTAQTGARAMPLKAFYNGEVTYDLNGFYLFKRYCDSKQLTDNAYQYMKETGGVMTAATGYYENHALEGKGPWLLNNKAGRYIGSYVESRYSDGDFIYAAGTIPTENDVRMNIVSVSGEENETRYYPVWPDDYLFFGQTLSYGHVNGRTHQEQPSRISRTIDNRLATGVESNRVYRAPAYFRSKAMQSAYFNPYAVFARTKSGDPAVKAHENMTAIDFAGHNGGAWQYGLNDGVFYGPLLDDGGLTRMLCVGLTKNLLAYTTTANAATNTVVSNYLQEPNIQWGSSYNTVAEADTSTVHVRGHWVEDGIARRNHLLIDEEDFNAPIAYRFDDMSRMWYQRNPERFVGLADGKTTGWEGVSLPFEAEVITTHQKGELTHFYVGSATGHEYWLRTYDRGTVEGDVLKATFAKPAAGTEAKEYNNTFLYDYYYSKNGFDDKNRDDYQQSYYAQSHTYAGYPRQQAGVPYMIGFPGKDYYEFDLSGTFVPENTAQPAPASLAPQTVSFVSKPRAAIAVSDDETGHKGADGYTFRANYLNQPDNRGADNTAYLLDARGESYAKTTGATLGVTAFRPYFLKGVASGRTRGSGSNVSRIVFGADDTRPGMVDDTDPRIGGAGDALRIEANDRHLITVESRLRQTAEVRVLNTAGILVKRITLEPGETQEVSVNVGGVYIVKTADGRFRKKLTVK